MTSSISVDEKSFRRILRRNVALPLGMGLISAIFFVVLVGYLLHVLSGGQHSNDVLRNAGEGLRLSVDQETGFRGFLLSGDVHFLQAYEVAKPKINAEIQVLRELVAGNSEQLEHLSNIAELQTAWVAFSQEVIVAKLNGGNYLDAIIARRGAQLTDAIRAEYAEFIAYERRQRQVLNSSAAQTAIISMLVFLLFCLTFGGALAFWGRRELLRLSSTYGAILKEQAAQAEILQAQAWLRNGQTEMAECLFGQQSMQSLGHNVLEFFAEHLGSVVGALYICEPYGSLRRVAAYGFAREQEQAQQSFYRAEGMVGQAALGHDLLVLEQLPADYLRVNSGLGSGLPVVVALLPIDNDSEINGVIELAFLKPLQEHEKEFLRRIASSVGTSLEAARYRHRLQEVLAETQQLNEELQVQQEELKSANEELEEQSKALLESQARLQQSNEQLSAQRDLLDERNARLRLVQLQLEERAEELQRASRYKSEFLANMSHELRTPLNSSLILAKLLGDNAKGNLDAEQVKFAKLIHGAGNDLLSLIDDILDLAKVEAGRLEVQPEKIVLRALLDDLESSFRPLANQKNLLFRLELDAALPEIIYSDCLRLGQILRNLLSNAFKFTEQGHVSLAVVRARGGLEFTVSDTGIGVSTEQQALIFEAFRQGDNSISRRFGGTGLGLSISRNLAELLGGSIGLQSVQEQGSQFSLWLPERYQAASETNPEASTTGSAHFALAQRSEVVDTVHYTEPVLGERSVALTSAALLSQKSAKSVLLVDDDRQQCDSIAALIGAEDIDIICVESAAQALQQLSLRPFDCMIVDLGLPDIQGGELLLRMGDGGVYYRPPVIVYTGRNLSREEEAELLKCSCSIILKGEKSAERLLDELKPFLHAEKAALADRESPGSKVVVSRDRIFAGRRILLVDDDVRNIFALTSVLELQGAEIAVARNGREAIDKLNAMDNIDLVLMDVMMPELDGYAATRQIRANPRWSKLPIIAVTAKAMKDDQEQCLQAGANDYLAKPIDIARLCSLIRLWLAKQETL